MAVYTYLTSDDIAHICDAYGLDAIEAAHPIAQGVENSNYLVEYRAKGSTALHKAILTIFEDRVDRNDVPFFLKLKQYLHHQGICCPQPFVTSQGHIFIQVQDKEAALVSFLEGHSIEPPAVSHISQAGHMLATMHLAMATFDLKRANTMSFDAWEALTLRASGKVQSQQDHDILALIRHELGYQRKHWPAHLPRGMIHGDLFPNNVFFDEQGTLSGVIDFYFACHDMLVYDLAIVANAWCMTADGTMNQGAYDALCHAYVQVRTLSTQEQEALPLLLRAAALRFLVTRFHDVLFHDADALLIPHDPMEYVRILQYHQQATTRNYV